MQVALLHRTISDTSTLKDSLGKALAFIDTWLELKYRHTSYPGFNICIFREGKILIDRSFGHADFDGQIPLRQEHIFRIGSLSKTYTALAVMHLQEKQVLDIGDPVIQYLPWLGKHADVRWEAITIKDLLTHTAGLCRNGPDSDFWNLTRAFPDDDELRDVVMAAELISEGKSKSLYSNLGYAILGQVVATVSKSTYSEYVAKHIIEPMHLSNTSSDFVNVDASKLVSGHTLGQRGRARAPIPATGHTNTMSAAGGFCSTAFDVCKFYSSFLPGQASVISEQTKTAMRTLRDRRDTGSGCGLGVWKHSRKSPVFGHSGMYPGQQAVALCAPSENVVVAALANCPDARTWDLAYGVVKIIEAFGRSSNTSKQWKFEYSKFEGCFENCNSITQVVWAGEMFMAVDPCLWYPFDAAVKLTPTAPDTLRFATPTGFNDPYDSIRYVFNSNNFAESIDYATITLKRWMSCDA
ncbi:MAG: beta-lactamase family protein [Cyanobacteria bacterium SZAS-4]|nr:beta-lactamase family protein [Cyanobacteria bacterium SZAS-4]